MEDIVPGHYYASQLTSAPPPSDKEYFLVEKVLKEKTVKGKKYFFCKFLFYPRGLSYKLFSSCSATEVESEQSKVCWYLLTFIRSYSYDKFESRL